MQILFNVYFMTTKLIIITNGLLIINGYTDKQTWRIYKWSVFLPFGYGPVKNVGSFNTNNRTSTLKLFLVREKMSKPQLFLPIYHHLFLDSYNNTYPWWLGIGCPSNDHRNRGGGSPTAEHFNATWDPGCTACSMNVYTSSGRESV